MVHAPHTDFVIVAAGGQNLLVFRVCPRHGPTRALVRLELAQQLALRATDLDDSIRVAAGNARAVVIVLAIENGLLVLAVENSHVGLLGAAIFRVKCHFFN